MERGGQCLSLMSMRHHVQPLQKTAQRDGRRTMERQHRIPTEASAGNLARAGFSSEEIVGLFRVKGLYHRGAYHEATPEYRRLAFVRWLYQQGRLHS
jgi:hypothetical protein